MRPKIGKSSWFSQLLLEYRKGFFLYYKKAYTADGLRKFITWSERDAFLAAAALSLGEIRTFSNVLAYTGCYLTEALELTFDRVDVKHHALSLEMTIHWKRLTVGLGLITISAIAFLWMYGVFAIPVEVQSATPNMLINWSAPGFLAFPALLSSLLGFAGLVTLLFSYSNKNGQNRQ